MVGMTAREALTMLLDEVTRWDLLVQHQMERAEPLSIQRERYEAKRQAFAACMGMAKEIRHTAELAEAQREAANGE